MFKPLKSLKLLILCFFSAGFIYAQGPSKTGFVSSNTNGQVGVFNLDEDGTANFTSFNADGFDSDGIAYTPNGTLYQVNRSSNAVVSYGLIDIMLGSGLTPNVVHSSTNGFYGFNFSNGRGIAVEDDKIVVAQDADGMNSGNRFIVYDINGFGSINFNKGLNVDINLWGIDLKDGTLYAVADNTNRVAVFEDFCDNIENDDGIIIPATGTGSSLGQSAGTGVSADAFVVVQNLVRTHGIVYVAERDLMILTDIGSAGSSTDGAIFVIYNYSAAAADGVIRRSEYIRIKGSNTRLGNPVDVDYCPGDNRIYIAERASGGGRLLAFDLPPMGSSGGNTPPVISVDFSGASSVAVGANRSGRWGGHLSESDDLNLQQGANAALDWSVFPSPAVHDVQVRWQQLQGSTKLSMRIVDINGQEVARKQVEAVTGLNTFELNVAGLITGIYRLIIEDGEDYHTQTFVKH